jgi:hypothetical protein
MSMRSTLLDDLVESAPDHRRFRKTIDQGRTRHVPGLAEVDCFLRDERQGIQLLTQDLVCGAFTYARARPS